MGGGMRPTVGGVIFAGATRVRALLGAGGGITFVGGTMRQALLGAEGGIHLQGAQRGACC